MELALNLYLQDKGLESTFAVSLVSSPSFASLTSTVTNQTMALLLLGFWQEQPAEVRLGGHWVTVAGFDGNQIYLADPFTDKAEVDGGGVVLGHPGGPHLTDEHNDPAKVSYDLYTQVAQSGTGGVWGPGAYLSLADAANFFVDMNNTADQDLVSFFDLADGSPLLVKAEYALFIDPVTLASVIISGPLTGTVNTSHPFTATIIPATATEPISYVWQATGQSPIVNTGGLSDTVSFAWSVTGRQTITVTATNPDGVVTDTHVITISTPPGGTLLQSVEISGPTSGTVNQPYVFTGVVSPLTVILPISYTWTPPPDSGQGTAVATYTWSTTGTQTITLTAQNAGSTVTDTHVITIGAPPGVVPLQSVIISGPTSGTVTLPYTFTGVVSPPTATVPISYTWIPLPDSGQGTAVVTYTWSTTGTQTITLTAQNVGSTVTDTHTIVISKIVMRRIYLPLILKN
jgi:hypothetical protein